MMDLDRFLAEAEARLKKATPGTWRVDYRANGGHDVMASVAWADVVARVWPNMKNQDADADFIAHAPSDLRKALNIIEIVKNAIEHEAKRDSPTLDRLVLAAAISEAFREDNT